MFTKMNLDKDTSFIWSQLRSTNTKQFKKIYFLAHNVRKWMKDSETTALTRVQGSNVFKPVGPTIILKHSSHIKIFNRIFNLEIKKEIIKRTTNDGYEKLNAKRTNVW